MKKTLIIMGIIGMFVLTSLAGVACAKSYRGIVCSTRIYPGNEEYQVTAFSLHGTLTDDEGKEQPYNFQKVKLIAITFFNAPRLAIAMLLGTNYIPLPLWLDGIIVE